MADKKASAPAPSKGRWQLPHRYARRIKWEEKMLVRRRRNSTGGATGCSMGKRIVSRDKALKLVSGHHDTITAMKASVERLLARRQSKSKT